MISPINTGDGLNRVFNDMNRNSKDLGVIGKLQVGDKLVVVQDATGTRLNVSKKGWLQGPARTLQNIFSSKKANFEDTLIYIRELNQRTNENIYTLSELSKVPNLTPEQLEKSVQTLKNFNEKTSAALEGLTNLSNTYSHDLLREEKDNLALAKQAGESIYNQLNTRLQQKKINEEKIIPLLLELEASDIPDAQQMNLQESKQTEAKKKEFQELLYETSKTADDSSIQGVRDAENEKQFKADLPRWNSLKVNGEELGGLKERNVDALSQQVEAAFGPAVAHLIVQSNVFDNNAYLIDEYKNSEHLHHISGKEKHIALYVHNGEVHLEIKTHFVMKVQKEEGRDPEYVFSRIAKREIIIPQKEGLGEENQVNLSKMRVIDSYSRVIPTEETAASLMKFA